MTLSAIDIVGIIVLAYNLLRGLATGLIRTGIGAIAVVVATYMAWQHQTWGGPVVNFLVPADWSMAFVMRPLIVWTGAFVLINAVGVLLRLGVRYTPLILADRILGGIFGLAVGVGVLLLPMLFIAQFPLLQQIPPIQDALKASTLVNWLSPALQILMDLSPGLTEGSAK
jgi:uncharacterized membrane protein required for colicin V production